MSPKTGGIADKSIEKVQKISQSNKNPKKQKRRESFSKYIYKVLKQVHPDLGITSKSMAIMNSLMDDIFDRIATEASRMTVIKKHSTMTLREIQTSVKLLLPEELAKHAISEGTKAVTKYTIAKEITKKSISTIS